jgi:hypothetical protein
VVDEGAGRVCAVGAALMLAASCASPPAAKRAVPSPTGWDAERVTVLAESRADAWADLRCPKVAVDSGLRVHALGAAPPIHDDPVAIACGAAVDRFRFGDLRPSGEVGMGVSLDSCNLEEPPWMVSGSKLDGAVVGGVKRDAITSCNTLPSEGDGPYVLRFDGRGACVFAHAVDPLAHPPQYHLSVDAVTVLDEAHLYVVGTVDQAGEEHASTYVERLDARGHVVFRRELPGFQTRTTNWRSPTPDHYGMQAVAVSDGVVVTTGSLRRDELRIGLEKIDERGATRWKVEWSAEVPFLAAGSDDHIYAAGFERDPPAWRGHVLVGPVAGFEPGKVVFRKLDASGKLLWSRELRAAVRPYILGLAADRDDRAWMMGYFEGRMTLGPTVVLEAPVRGEDHGFTVFLARFSPVGEVEWAVTLGEQSATVPLVLFWPLNALVADAAGNVVGTFLDEAPTGLPGAMSGPSAGQAKGKHRCRVLRMGAPASAPGHGSESKP